MANRGGTVSQVSSGRVAVLVALIVGGVLSGCSFSGTSFQSFEDGGRSKSHVEGEKAAVAKQTTAVELRALKSSADSVSAIELLWEVPQEPVEGFIVRYGAAHEALTAERRLAVADIERIEDPSRGRLYRYVIEGIPVTQRVFLTIAAFNGDHESPPSRVFEVFPGEPQ